jgi:hypothetical protein
MGNKKYFLVMAGCLLLLFAAEYFKPRPINWDETFSRDDKIPYGTYLVREMLPRLFPGQPITDNYRTFYELEREHLASDSVVLPKNYVIITNYYYPDSLASRALLSLAYAGSDIFIASNALGGPLGDSLKVTETDNFSISNVNVFKEVVDSLGLNFVNPALRAPEAYYYRRGSLRNHYFGADSLATTILGRNSLNAANFIRIRFGEGNFWLHCNPLVFTNYNMLYQNNHEYIAKAFSYLPAKRPVVWDEYPNVGRRENRSPLRFVFDQEALAWAWRLALGALLLYILFAVKRRQRIIPIVNPPLNTTLEFARTIGRLYYLHRDHQDLARKKTAYFMEHVRSHLYLSTSGVYPFTPENLPKLDEFAQRLAQKAGQPLDQVKKLLNLMVTVERGQQITEDQLTALSNQVEQFYQRAEVKL